MSAAISRDVTWRDLLMSGRRDDADMIRLWKILLESFGTPFCLGLHAQITNGDILSALKQAPDPRNYGAGDADKFLCDVQGAKFLQKFPFETLKLDTHAAALNTFFEGEQSCRDTNALFNGYAGGRVSLQPKSERILTRARDFISATLGALSVEEWLEGCRFGPGVSAFMDCTLVDLAEKLANNPTVTAGFEPYALAFLAEYPGWVDSLTFGGTFPFDMVVVPGGKHATVPKNAFTDRNIEPQPTINIFAQLGLGACIRERLKRVGIDLQHGQEVNRKLAREGSVTGKLATIDLSNASDTVSYELVRFLLPPDWFHALDITRTSQILVEDEWVTLHKFSAMGNGYTFELESLIFLALAVAVCGPKARVSVYGDDIIVPSRNYVDVCQALTLCGFTPNPKKSFSTGYFRESCGADWFNGKIVRPYQLKETVTDVPSLISLANGLARAALRSNRGYGFDRRYRAARVLCLRWIHPGLRSRIALGVPEGDEYLLSWKFRGTRFVAAKTRLVDEFQWYRAKAVALYNTWQRGRLIPASDHIAAALDSDARGLWSSNVVRTNVTVPLSHRHPYASMLLSELHGGPPTGGSRRFIRRPTRSISYELVPGNSLKQYRDFGATPLMGCDVMVPEVGYV